MIDYLEPLAIAVLSGSVKSLPILAFGGLGARALRRAPAATRHRWWAATLAVVTLLPLASWLGPRWEIPWGVSRPSAPSAVQEPATLGAARVDREGTPVWSPGELHETAATELTAWTEVAARWGGALYLAGLLAGLGYLGLGAARVAGLCRRSGSDVSAREKAELLARAELESPDPGQLRLRLSSETGVPFTWGLVHPVIVLPIAAPRWGRERLRNVLVHELAHVERRDGWFQWASRLVSVLYWCQPMVGWAGRRMRLEAEKACDERVVAAGGSATGYAQLLIDLTRGARRGALQPAALGLARRGDLPARIGALLTPPGRRRRPAAVASLMVSLTLVGMGTAALHSADRDARRERHHARASTPLLEASRRGEIGEVRRLIASGADVDQAVPGQGTPLIRAARQGHRAVVEELLQSGADPNRVEGRGWRPDDLPRSPLGAAARSGSVPIVRALLDAGAAVDRVPRGDASPLMEAARGRHLEVVSLLLERGAQVDRRLPGDGTALIAAVRGGSESVVRTLLRAGADPSSGVPGDGNPLIAAVETGDSRLVALLVEAGADPYAFVRGDDSALSRAAEQGRRDLVELLVRRQRR